MKLYNEKGEEAGLYDVCEWWFQTYPSDIFIGLTDSIKLIADIRMNMRNIMLLRDMKQSQLHLIPKK